MDLPWQVDLMMWFLIVVGIVGALIMAFSPESE